MSETVEVFENEEAVRLLEYFAAYNKLQSKIEQIKCIAATNSEITLRSPQTPDLGCELSNDEAAFGLNSSLDE